ncbi:hypothetical protein B0T24DRAFT_618523 [Lasiosphaeria ovina]|uniref:Secreted protein n=1 Tax=Lasiosphaeria ovina TaxID=92902 RepID=A0AAE0NA24_9PEZI|nr:hypothetical protein B0T24DRAFT_618523 [Lasiosphaeria ovina]
MWFWCSGWRGWFTRTCVFASSQAKPGPAFYIDDFHLSGSLLTVNWSGAGSARTTSCFFSVDAGEFQVWVTNWPLLPRTAKGVGVGSRREGFSDDKPPPFSR